MQQAEMIGQLFAHQALITRLIAEMSTITGRDLADIHQAFVIDIAEIFRGHPRSALIGEIEAHMAAVADRVFVNAAVWQKRPKTPGSQAP